MPTPTGPAGAEERRIVPPPAWDLRCIQLVPTGRVRSARGVVTLTRPPSPFGVTVTPEGRHVWRLAARIEGLPDPSSLGPYTTYVAWATPLTLDPVVRLGALAPGAGATAAGDGGEGAGGALELGEVDFTKFLVMVSAEASADVTEREGPLVMRGRSPSSNLEAHDMLAQAPSAEQRAGAGGGHAAGHDPSGHGHAQGGADPHGGGATPGPDGWRSPPGYPGVPMLPGIMALRPTVSPLLLGVPDAGAVPEVAPREVVTLPDGGTLDLTAGFVRKRVGGRELVMLAFNGQHPGPLIQVAENTTIFVNFRNETPFPTAVHWHGLRLDNRFDGVPGVTQDPVLPGESFRYTLRFPDAGIYWYHPHHREDVQQELGLYGNMLVDPLEPRAYGPVNREEVLMLDDLLLHDPEAAPEVVAFGDEGANFALMGRFGNVMLVNGEPAWRGRARRGEVVRFFLTNAANTRTFNLSVRRVEDAPAADAPADALAGGGEALAAAEPLPMKVVATDVGRFEREERVRSVVVAPAERYVVDVLFPEAGTWALVNHVQGINHRMGVFQEEVRELGRVEVADEAPDRDLRAAFETLRVHEDVVAEIDRLRDRFDDPVEKEIVLTLEAEALPLPVEQAMRYDWIWSNPVEWTGTMPMMNWAVSAEEVTWTIREPSTGRENMEIDWRFRVGDVVKIRVHNDRRSVHAMQHPLHIHGQRFLVLEQDGIATENLAWKDTVLLPPGSTTDLLLELSNPGAWMVHCHIAEHLEAGMKFVFDVEGT